MPGPNTKVSLLATVTMAPCDAGPDGLPLVAAGTPITPSPFKSWWKPVSSDSSVVLVPETTPIRFEM